MNRLILFNNDATKALLKKRDHETKFGEHVCLLSKLTNIYDDLVDLDVDFVIFGIPEDIGVFANYGQTGTSKAWEATLKILLNIQSNRFTAAKKVLILGHLDYSKYLEQLKDFDQTSKKDIVKARKIVSKIDQDVTYVVHQIVKAGKTPIIIGGGHNNAYGNIKGTALAKGKAINVINFDAHTDFRKEEGRHSGNGFRYAYTEGFLDKYFIFGIHENYTSDKIFKTINKVKAIKYNTFEALRVRGELKFKSELQNALKHINTQYYGIEIDCDAIENIGSSAMTPSGFSVRKVREFVHFFGKQPNATYLHICEGALKKDNDVLLGKLITYLITDFIRAKHINLH